MHPITWPMVSDAPDTELHEYAFDVKLFAAVRVKAYSLGEAKAAMAQVIDGMEPCADWISGFNGASRVKLTEVSLSRDGVEVFEIDGVEL